MSNYQVKLEGVHYASVGVHYDGHTVSGTGQYMHDTLVEYIKEQLLKVARMGHKEVEVVVSIPGVQYHAHYFIAEMHGDYTVSASNIPIDLPTPTSKKVQVCYGYFTEGMFINKALYNMVQEEKAMMFDTTVGTGAVDTTNKGAGTMDTAATKLHAILADKFDLSTGKGMEEATAYAMVNMPTLLAEVNKERETGIAKKYNVSADLATCSGMTKLIALLEGCKVIANVTIAGTFLKLSMDGEVAFVKELRAAFKEDEKVMYDFVRELTGIEYNKTTYVVIGAAYVADGIRVSGAWVNKAIDFMATQTKKAVTFTSEGTARVVDKVFKRNEQTGIHDTNIITGAALPKKEEKKEAPKTAKPATKSEVTVETTGTQTIVSTDSVTISGNTDRAVRARFDKEMAEAKKEYEINERYEQKIATTNERIDAMAKMLDSTAQSLVTANVQIGALTDSNMQMMKLMESLVAKLEK